MLRLQSLSRRSKLAAGFAAVVLAGAITAAVVVMATAGGGGEPSVVAPTPSVEHGPLSDGWSPTELTLPGDTYQLRPLAVTEAGVAVDSGFELVSKAADIDRDAALSMLRVEPAVEFSAESKGARTVRFTPRSIMRRETSYRFTLVDPQDHTEIRSWAFQTESPLRVVQALPANQAVAVPAATGIELTFSHDGITGIEERFHIEPAVEGRFETHKRVVVFVPKKLEYQTLYTVTLDPGVGVTGSDLTTQEPYVFSFETGSLDEREDQNYNPGPTFARLLNEAGTAETPALQILSFGDLGADVPFEVFRYPDLDAFTGALTQSQSVPQWSYWGRRDFRVETNGLERVASFQTKLVTQQANYSTAFFAVFPEALPEGYYLVETTDRGVTGQTLLQVTDVAAYASMSETKTLVWANDLATKAAIDGARVRDQHGHSFETGSDGVAFFDTPNEILPTEVPAYDPYRSSVPRAPVTPGYLLVEHDSRVAVVPLSDADPIGFIGYRGDYGRYSSIYYGGGSPDYWSYVYTDRPLYRKTDDVHVWGIARRREGFKDGEQLTLRVTGDNYYDYNYQPSVIAETSVTVDDLGAFEATIPLSGVGAGYYSLQVLAGDETAVTGYVQVEDFVKPAYKIDITPSKRAVIAGEAITFEIAAQFFDGSPVPFVDLVYGGDIAPVEQPIRTDAQGKATITYVATPGSTEGVNYRYVYARPTGPEEGEINAQSAVYVLSSNVTFDGVSSEVETGDGIVTGNVNDVDLAAFDEIDPQYGGTGDYIGAPAAGATVTGRITEISYNKVETGEIYDFIAKITRKQYRYDTIETPRGSVTATTGTDGSFELRFPAGADRSYRVDLSVQDDAGRTTTASAWVSGDALPYYPSYGDNFLSIAETDVTADPRTGYQAPQYYSDGELVDVTLRRGHDRGEEADGIAYLFQRAQSGLREYAVQPSPRYAFEFRRDDAPNIVVGGVQFNGHGYEPVLGDYNAAFDNEDATLEIAVTADRERYSPGDDVTLEVETRASDGSPTEAQVVLSLVDEAIFRINGNGYDGNDIVQQLYRSLPSGVVASYVPSFTSSDPYAQAAFGGRGGGGPDTGGIASPNTGPGQDPRKDFRDTALFRTVRTDGDGHGSITFTLPDNITSWRVSSRAVSGDLRAGAAVSQVPAGLPFFVDATISEEYLAADRPTIALRSFGLDLQDRVMVHYTVRIPSLGIDAIAAEGLAFQRTDVVLPALAEGEHEVTIEATSAGDLGDAIVRTLRVVSSRLRKGDANFYELTSGVALEGAAGGRTRVVFSDHNRGRYYDDLLQLGWTYGDRVDQMLARSLAQDLLATYFEAENLGAPAAFDAGLYQTNDGGIALFPYADDELALSARIAAVAAGRFSDARLAQYFGTVLDDPSETRERSIIALFGLAATGAPVQSSIDQFAAADDLTVRERLYLGLAALASGDETNAREQYRQVMLGYGERREPFVRVRTGIDQDDIIEATSLAAALAAGLGDGSAPALFAYTTENRTTDILVELDQISYLARALPRLPAEPVSFSYTLDGESHTATLEAGASMSLSVTPDQLAALNPQAIDGSVGVATFFESAFDPAALAVDADISVTRTIDVDGGGIGEGDLVLIRLDYEIGPQALDGCYQITDLAPSGLRPVSRTLYRWETEQPSGGDRLYPYLIDGQRVSFCAYRSDTYRPAMYWARVVTKGQYEAEPAIMQSQQSAQSINYAPAAEITVQ